MPASRKDIEDLAICKTKIEHIEESIKELKEQISEQIKEKNHKEERISDRRLAIYLAFASILGAAIIEAIQLAITYLH